AKMIKTDHIRTRTNSPDGIIRFVVDKPSMLDIVGKFSDEIEVGGVPWIVNAYKDEFRDLDFFTVALVCMTNQATQWSIDVQSEFILVHPDRNAHLREEVKETSIHKDTSIDAYNITRGMLEWRKFVDNKKGFIKDDSITVEVRFWIVQMKGIKDLPRVDFTDPNE
ncbi:hypothetical protein PMAYCL1PPCAC_24893, partial [Pristionchus mayeri]